MFVDAVFGVFRFDEAKATVVAADRAGVVDQGLNEQVALVARQFDAQGRVVSHQRRHDVAHDQLFAQGRIADAADAGQVRFHEMERVLPARGGEIADGIETAVDRVVAVVRRCPRVAQPPFFVGRDGDDASDFLVVQIERWQPL